MQRPMLGHLDPAFHAVLDEVVALLRAVWKMPDGDVFALPSTGTSAMEAGLVNLLEPGDTAIVAEAGFFGKRLGDMAERRGANVVRVTAPGARRCRTRRCSTRWTATPRHASSRSCTPRRRPARCIRCASSPPGCSAATCC